MSPKIGKKSNGLIQIPLLIGLLLIAIAVPVATSLVQKNQDTRNRAASPLDAHTPTNTPTPTCSTTSRYYGMPCCPGYREINCQGSGSYATCTCTNQAPTATPATQQCTVRTCGPGVCNTTTQTVDSAKACPPSNCIQNSDCPTPTPTSAGTPTPLVGTCTQAQLGYHCYGNISRYCSAESGGYYWIPGNEVNCGTIGCNSSTGMCNPAPTPTSDLKNECRSGDSCVSGMAGSCSGSTYAGYCEYMKILGSPQVGTCCTKNSLTPTPPPETCSPKGATKCVTNGSDNYVYKCLDSSYYTGLRWQKDSFCGTASGSCSNGSCVVPTPTPDARVCSSTSMTLSCRGATVGSGCSTTLFPNGHCDATTTGSNPNCSCTSGAPVSTPTPTPGSTNCSTTTRDYLHKCCTGYHEENCQGSGSYATCSCVKDSANPTPTPLTQQCTVRTCGNNVCNVSTQTVASNLACPASNCLFNSDCVGNNTPTPTAGGSCSTTQRYYGMPCCPGYREVDCTGSGSYATCKCTNTTPTATPPTQQCTVRTCGTNKVCNTATQTVDSAKACPPSDCIQNTDCGGINPSVTPTPTGTGICMAGIVNTFGCGGQITQSIASQYACKSLSGSQCGAHDWTQLNRSADCACNIVCANPGTCNWTTPTTPPGTTPTSGPSPTGKPPQCVEECPGITNTNGFEQSDLKSCNPPDSDGTPKETICSQQGLTSVCGGKQYCCPKQNGTWTTDMSQCQAAKKCTQCANDPTAKSKGDADCAGGTTINDASIWRAEFIAGGLGSTVKNDWKADFDCDGKVTINDASIWRTNFIKGL